MEEIAKKNLEDALGDVMTRFRDFFLQHMNEDHVPFRHRDDFVAPLVTVMGHTYGARIVPGDSNEFAVEISANVYDDEFDLERFETRIEAAHQPERVKKTVENFMSPDDPDYVAKKGYKKFPALFSCNYESDLELDRKDKKSASKVTGKLVDTVLTLKYWVDPEQLAHLAEDLVLFKSAVYFYCLRTFVLAYHESLISD
jgi:hypothetical protein